MWREWRTLGTKKLTDGSDSAAQEWSRGQSPVGGGEKMMGGKAMEEADHS